jgi:hypothetical protein
MALKGIRLRALALPWGNTIAKAANNISDEFPTIRRHTVTRIEVEAGFRARRLAGFQKSIHNSPGD